MSHMKKILTSTKTTGLMFVLAAALLLFAGVGGARAALAYYSDTYTAEVQMFDIGVSLLERTDPAADYNIIASRNYSGAGDGRWVTQSGALLETMLGDGESLVPGKVYPEYVAASNSGTINEFVRITIRKYWTDAEGAKRPDLSPDLITIGYAANSGWTEDTSSATAERRVFYYNNVLLPGAETNALTESVSISGSVATKVTQTRSADGKTITTTYDYDGVRFVLEAEVDAVQDHNAADAALSAWGKTITTSGEGDNKTMTLAQ
ncbi:MAG: hypothetical protein ACOX8R_02750 [Bacillota bacterium]|jgi:hypothetical protein